jgi:methionine salvage enolase-phosphatase E1
MLFISDARQELEAAHETGCVVLMCVRPGHSPDGRSNAAAASGAPDCAPSGTRWASIRDFGEVDRCLALGRRS